MATNQKVGCSNHSGRTIHPLNVSALRFGASFAY
jgi:hypothetical protein